jgi:hypothetical protein
MKINRVLCLSLALAVPQFALAELPVSSQTLGQVEGILSFCTKMDSGLAKYYEQQSRALVGNATAKELAEARDSSEYKEAYEAINAELEKVDKERAADSCSSVVHGNVSQ